MEERTPNIDSDIKMVYPDVENIRCKDCMFRAPDTKVMKGACYARCDVYPRNDKPVSILFYSADCEYYVDENTK